MDMQLRGRRALITGSTQGIGFAVAASLAQEGADVILNGRSQERINGAVARLQDAQPGARVEGIPADVSESAEAARLAEEAGEVDILVNSAGIFDLETFTEADDATWQRYLDVNLMSGVRLCRAMLGGMLERGWGRIVFVGSESGVNVPSDMIPYGVSKAAGIALTNGLAKLTRGTGVTVNTVLGGPTYSDGVAATVEAIAEAQSAPPQAIAQAIIGQNQTTLLERFIAPEEIAHLVTYLASPLSSATNGAALRADGGVLTAML